MAALLAERPAVLSVEDATDTADLPSEPELQRQQHVQVPFSPKAPVAKAACSGETYLVYFIHRLLDFRRPEFEAVAELCGTARSDLQWHEPYGGDELSPFWYATVPDEGSIKQIYSRSLLTKIALEVWGEGNGMDELQQAIEAYPRERMEPYLSEDVSIKVIVDGWGQKVAQEKQVELIERLDFIPFKGKIDLKTPQHKFWLVVADSASNPGLPQIPYRIYFGREVAATDRDIVNQYSLKARRYLGPTSMDAEMAFLICNQAKVAKGGMVLDPYVGTGSVLVAAAHYGAHTLGSDIDVRVIRDGKADKQGRHNDIWSNFEQYQLQQPLGLLRMDMHTPPYRAGLEEIVNAVVGDPPYGVRAGAKKMVPKDVLIRNRQTHVPSTDPYCLGEVLRDLLDVSARLLTLGGRLVYFLPATPETYKEEEIPSHPCLVLVSNTEQMLTTRYSRRLVTMEKVKRYDAEEARRFHLEQGDPVMSIDRIHELVYECIKGGDRRAPLSDKAAAGKRCRGKLV